LSVNGLEIELKAGLEPRTAALLAHRLTRRAGPAETLKLHAVYFDTAGRLLQAAGISLRVRREGRQWVQAAKWGRTGNGGFQQLREVECRLARCRPDVARFQDPSLRAAVFAAVGEQQLVPWFETRVNRRIWQVRHPIGLVEVALDRGTIEASGSSAAVLEAEFELKEGSPEAVFLVAAELLGDLPADLLLPSKSARGARLATHGERIAAVKRKALRRDPPQDGATSWTAVLAVQAAAVAAELHRLFTCDEPEGPHQLRVSLRRLRAAERLHRPLLDPTVAAGIAASARAIGRIVAPLRDSDVMVATICAEAEATPALALALTDAGAEIRERVRQELRQSSATSFAIHLIQLASIGGWRPHGRPRACPVRKLSEAVLIPHWKRMTKLGDRLSILDDEGRHEFRKDLKKLRYLLEISGIREFDKFASSLKKLQENLGTLNDLSVLALWSPDLPEQAAVSFDAARAALLQSSKTRADAALGRACRHWRTIRALPQPWVSPTAP
jgi:triphosphatase